MKGRIAPPSDSMSRAIMRALELEEEEQVDENIMYENIKAVAELDSHVKRRVKSKRKIPDVVKHRAGLDSMGINKAIEKASVASVK